jgi:hypothetical protein
MPSRPMLQATRDRTELALGFETVRDELGAVGLRATR